MTTEEGVFLQQVCGGKLIGNRTFDWQKFNKDMLFAVGISAVCIIIYIAWRFGLKFGIGAILSTLHDVQAMAAVFVVGNGINLLCDSSGGGITNICTILDSS